MTNKVNDHGIQLDEEGNMLVPVKTMHSPWRHGIIASLKTAAWFVLSFGALWGLGASPEDAVRLSAGVAMTVLIAHGLLWMGTVALCMIVTVCLGILVKLGEK